MVAIIEDPKAQDIIEEMTQLEADRQNWDTLYQECADYAMPDNNQIVTQRAEGQEAMDLFDTTAEESNIQLASGLYSFLFPTDSRAFVLEIDDEKLSNDDEVASWLEKVTKIIHKHLVNSNFREAFFEYLKSLGTFGTSDMHVEKGKKKPIVFTNYFIGDFYIRRNSDGDVDTVFRKFKFTARQAVQEFGEENLGEKILKAFENPKRRNKTKFKFIHKICPREDRDIEKDDPTNMPIASINVSVEDKKVVSESGFQEMPDMVSVFDKDSKEDLGRSPTMKKLPDIRMVNSAAKLYIKGSEKMVDPPILTPDDGSIWPLATQPGGQIHFRAGGDKPEWFKFEGNLNHLEKFIERVQHQIQKGFFLDMFDPLVDRNNMTATEVLARVEQQIRFLTPIIGRLQSGLFNPMIQRIIGILGRGGFLPALPEQLEDVDYRVMYLGRLALAMKTLETEGLARTFEQFKPLADVGVLEWLDNINLDAAFRGVARNNGVPATWLTDVKEMKKDRDARELKRQQQEAIAAAPELAKAAKQGGTKPEEGSLTERALQNVA
jgi:hypothetical protein